MRRQPAALAWSVWAITAMVCGINVTLFHGRVQVPQPTDEPSRVGEVLFLLLPLVFVSVGALVATHRPNNPIGWLLCAGFGSTAGYAFAAGYAWTGLVVSPGQLPGADLAGWASNWLWIPGLLAIVLVLLVFPDGRLPSPRRFPLASVIAGAFLLVGVAAAVMPGPLNNIRSVDNPLGVDLVAGPSHAIFFLAGPFMLVALAVGFLALGLRFRRSRGVERQQLKWLAYAASFAPLAAVNSFIPVLGTWSLLAMWAVFYAIAGAIGVAILRYRLYDIDLLIHRTLVYGALTAVVVAVYVGVVGYLGALLRTQDNLAVSLVATGAVAVLFQPLRERLQRGINRLLYGQRDEPYAALAELGRRLEATLTQEAILPTIAESVAHALRLPYTAIALKRAAQLRCVASYGQPTADLLQIPVVYQSEHVGELSLAPRQPGEAFSAADRRLLDDLARQAGVAAHAVRVTADLQASLVELRRSRGRLVVAQEHERQRIQRDLHDGLGPTLASMRLRLEACLELAGGDSADLVAELEQLHALVGEATADIRRLVHDLRPPVLDQLGLVQALQQHVERFSREAAVAVTIHADRNLRVRPAAEVALFRVAQEALLNVHKHARATRVDVRVEQRPSEVVLEVTDDGVGLADDSSVSGRGAGLRGMRDRADLLGGRVDVARNEGGGTRLILSLPSTGA